MKEGDWVVSYDWMGFPVNPKMQLLGPPGPDFEKAGACFPNLDLH